MSSPGHWQSTHVFIAFKVLSVLKNNSTRFLHGQITWWINAIYESRMKWTRHHSKPAIEEPSSCHRLKVAFLLLLSMHHKSVGMLRIYDTHFLNNCCLEYEAVIFRTAGCFFYHQEMLYEDSTRKVSTQLKNVTSNGAILTPEDIANATPIISYIVNNVETWHCLQRPETNEYRCRHLHIHHGKYMEHHIL